MEKGPLGEEAPALRADPPWWDLHAQGGGHNGFAKPKPLCQGEVGAAGPPGCPQTSPKPLCGPPPLPPGMLQDPPFLPVGLARRSWGSGGGDPSPYAGCGPCSSAAPAAMPGWGGRDARALPVLAPSRPLPPPPGTCINCSCFPSLTALLLAGTNCESPQGPTARPARDVPPSPRLVLLRI